VRQLAAAFLLRACPRFTAPGTALLCTASKLAGGARESGRKLPPSSCELARTSTAPGTALLCTASKLA